MKASAPALLSLALLAACGAGTPLGELDSAVAVDAAVDAPPPPDCGPALAPGALRFRVPRAIGPAAVDPSGNWYVPRREPDAGVALASYDACGAQRWERHAIDRFNSNGLVEARLGPGDRVALTSSMFGGLDGQGFFPFTRDGGDAPRPRLPPGARLVGTLSWTARSVLVAETVPNDASVLQRVAEYGNDGAPLRVHPSLTVVTDGQLQLGRTVLGADSRYDLDAQRFLYASPTELLDGTFRHALPVAPDGDRYYALLFGVRTYVLVARALDTGRELWRVLLADSPRGQTNLLAGGPLLTQGHRVVVYLHNSGVPGGGALRAFSREGMPLWTSIAPASRELFFEYATHLAAADGLLYLAVGSTLRALDESDGHSVLEVPLPEPANRAAPLLSPAGDLALRTDSDNLLVYAVSSRALASSSWPVSWGGAERRNAL